MANVGDRTTCVYTKGRLVKQIKAKIRYQRLAFDVVEQAHIEPMHPAASPSVSVASGRSIGCRECSPGYG
jgi:hypothetical protein